MQRLALLFTLLSLLGSAHTKPNIVFILADDLGYGDLGCYGQKTLQTPNIDKMAAEGMRFTRHYSGSTVCAPSRCVLMTGLHTGHCSVRGNGRASMPLEDVTVAEVLKEAGYATGLFGKWGIGNPPQRDDPNRQGFDEFYGYANMFHAHNFYPEFLIRNGKKEKLRNIVKAPYAKFRGSLAKEGVGVAREKLDYAPDFIHAEALKFIDAKKDAPFFLYYALNTPHANNEGGRDEDDSRGMEVPDLGEFGKRDWPNPEKGFAAMIRNIDNYIGEVLAKLKEHGLDQNTLVIFSSDNGPHQEGRHKMEFFDSNGELRGMKRDLFEGGVRVPTIARWPGKVPANSTNAHLSGFQDFLATCAEITGAKTPPIDGISYLPTLVGDPDRQAKHNALYWEFSEQGGKVGVVTEKWKAVRLGTLKNPEAPVQLFDLEVDLGEKQNVAADHPETVKKLAALMEKSHREIAPADIFAKKNLVAWCIVPFDAKKRGPAARAEMLVRLGLRKCAYDWRQEHVATFEEEILQYKKHGIEFFAFWDAHEEAFALFEKYKLTPQIWRTAPSPAGETQEARVAAAAKAMLPLVERTRRLGSKLGLYNHGGWGGEPANLVAVCKWLREHHDADHVGIVYNLHHGHEHIGDFAAVLELMKPHLLCLNLNGMNTGAKPKILPVGKGEHDRALLKTIRNSGYRGPIGVIDHRSEMDSEESLRENLVGLERVKP